MPEETKKKTLFEEFTKFFENPTREGLRELIKNNIGELPQCDFKKEWPSFPKFARHLLGLANSRGGCIILGIAQHDDNSLERTGLQKMVDKAEVVNSVKKFLPDVLLQSINILDFSYDASEYKSLVGKRFQVVLVEDDPKHLPFISTGEGDSIRPYAVYVRRGTSTEEANYQELQEVINRRLETGYSSAREIDLLTHLEQLKMLYRQIDRVRAKNAMLFQMPIAKFLQSITMGGSEPNPNYPKEDFEAFIVQMIGKKKRRIEMDLDVSNL